MTPVVKINETQVGQLLYHYHNLFGTQVFYSQPPFLLISCSCTPVLITRGVEIVTDRQLHVARILIAAITLHVVGIEQVNIAQHVVFDGVEDAEL